MISVAGIHKHWFRAFLAVIEQKIEMKWLFICLTDLAVWQGQISAYLEFIYLNILEFITWDKILGVLEKRFFCLKPLENAKVSNRHSCFNIWICLILFNTWEVHTLPKRAYWGMYDNSTEPTCSNLPLSLSLYFNMELENVVQLW
jgi:hypothetical protein